MAPCNETANGTPDYLNFSLEAGDNLEPTTLGQLLQEQSSLPQNGLTPTVVTQLQPPMLPPPPYPSFKLVPPHTDVPPWNQPLLVTEKIPPKTSGQQRLHERQTILTSPEQHFHEVVNKSLTGSFLVAFNTSVVPLAGVILGSQKLVPEHSLHKNFDFLKSESRIPVSKQSDSHPFTPSFLQWAQLNPQPLTKRQFQQSVPVSNQALQTKLGKSSQTVGWKTQKSLPEQSSTQSNFVNLDLKQPTGSYVRMDQTVKSLVYLDSNQSGTQLSPVPPDLHLTIASHTTQPLNSQLQPPTPWTETESFQDNDSNPPSSSIYPVSQNSDSSSKHQPNPDFHQVNISDQFRTNISTQTNSVHLTKVVNDTEVTELLKKNTSQSPMTSNDPR